MSKNKSARQVQKNMNEELDKLIQGLKDNYSLDENILDESTLNFGELMKYNEIPASKILDEIEAILFNEKTGSPTLKLIEKALKTCISTSENINKKHQKLTSMTADFKKMALNKIKAQTSSNSKMQITSKIVFSDNDNYTISTNEYNSNTIHFDSNTNNEENKTMQVSEYDLIPKDEGENLDEYKIYFAEKKKVMLSKLNISEDDALLDLNKFVLMMSFDSTEPKPYINELVGIDPLKDYEKYILKLENIDSTLQNLYSGQIMYVEGDIKENIDNRSHKTIIVRSFVSGIQSESYEIPDELVKGYFIEQRPYLIYSMNGPFYSKIDINLHVFIETLKYMKDSNPHCIILNGPFINTDNEFISSGSIGNDDPNFSYFQLFEFILKEINNLFKNTRTLILITPSLYDEINYYPLPQPKFDIQSIKGLSDIEMIKNEQMIFLSNPQLFQLNEIIIANANYDFILEINNNSCKNKKPPIENALEAVINQRSLFPIIQNSVTLEDVDKIGKVITCDYTKIKEFSFEMIPDIIITNSIMIPFAKKFNNTIFINSGPLFKGKTTGNFAKIISYPPSPLVGNDIIKRLKVEMCKIDLEIVQSKQLEINDKVKEVNNDKMEIES